MRRFLVLVLAAACNWGPDPDTERFSCNVNVDCGRGFECIPQLGGGSGRCFREGHCADDETCNEVDDDCDGVIDDGFDFASHPLHCGGCNVVCASGSLCTSAACTESACADAADNDADGLTDCDDADCNCGT